VQGAIGRHVWTLVNLEELREIAETLRIADSSGSVSVLTDRTRCGWKPRHSAGVSRFRLRAGWTAVSWWHGQADGQRRRPPGHGSGVRGYTPHHSTETHSVPLRVELRVVSGNGKNKDREFGISYFCMWLFWKIFNLAIMSRL
jgi:hypothetical protein